MMTQRIQRLLIANRGEIAVRIIRTCRAMGIEAVTIYSEHDAELPHALLSNAAYSLGSGTLAETYLNIPKIIEIAKTAGADAIHPGYGFLSENAGFAEAVAQAGLIFVGPPVACIRDMGDKIAARDAAMKAGVPVVPGYDGAAQDEATLQREAGRIGYPVMVKASAGGGGKGMRIVWKQEEFASSLDQAKSEARNAFGDDRVFLEKYITSPRHIEVQLFSDTHGNHVHLFERECSIQRRHQKIVEESPSTAVDAATRAKITGEAVALARQIGYVGAGTVEFIMEPSGKLYFLEMNTRLQVEHPVTEAITGQDLVRWQIEVAEGKPLPLAQSDITCKGHAVEVRVYAEDPERGYLPATGKLEHIGTPEVRNLRLDSGYRPGNDVSMHYDPMLAKVIARGEDRASAVQSLREGLKQLTFAGVKTNPGYLLKILAHPAFGEGKTYTDFLEVHGESLAATATDRQTQAAALAAFLLLAQKSVAEASGTVGSVWASSALAGYRNV